MLEIFVSATTDELHAIAAYTTPSTARFVPAEPRIGTRITYMLVGPEREATTLRALDLFAGVGGLSEGIRQGIGALDVVAAVEYDKRAAAGYAYNHPEADVFAGDIRTWGHDTNVPGVDVVIGGPPCQGFSQLGKQEADDERNSLWREYARIVHRAQPKYFVMENVPALLKSAELVAFRNMTSRGGNLRDYVFEPLVMNAADHGAAQMRKRVIVIGRRRDMPRVDHPLPKFSRSTYRTVGDVLKNLPLPGSALPNRHVELTDGSEAPGVFAAKELHVTRNFSALSRERFRHIPYGGNRFDLPYDLLSPCWQRHTSGSGDVMGRLVWEKPSVTIRTEFVKPEKGRYLHPVENRAITPYEGALIQGFPEDYKFIGSMTDVVRQIGNAVPIPLGTELGKVIRMGLDGHGYERDRTLF